MVREVLKGSSNAFCEPLDWGFESLMIYSRSGDRLESEKELYGGEG